MRTEKKFLTMILILALQILVACHGLVVVDPQTRLKERIDGFIFARQARDQAGLQAFYLNPGQARIGNIIYKSCKIAAIDFSDEGRRAEVKLKNTIQTMGFTFKDTPQTTTWVWQDKDWYLVVNQKANPMGKSINKPEKNSKYDEQK